MTSRDDVIYMQAGDAPIELRQPVASYHATKHYDHNLLNSANTWHQIIVHHKKKYNKKQILDTFYEIVGDDEFYPVAYRESQLRDIFLIRQCRIAIQKLFDRSLTLIMPMGDEIQLTFKFSIADYKYGQIYPAKKIEKVIENQFKNLETVEGVSNVLNLVEFSSHQDIVINLSNKSALELLCKIIVQNHQILNEINGLKLSNNNIISLMPMEIFSSITFQIFDIRDNNIKQISQFKYLKDIKIKYLCVVGNPVTQKRGFQEQLKCMLPSVKLDMTHSENVKQDNTICKNIEIGFEGDLIVSNIGAIFNKYSGSEKWHQVVIVHNGKYLKSEILNALFEVCNEIYPCYYKIGPKEDSFFVRNSFSQLKILNENNMILKIPNKNDYVKIFYHMNVGDFQKGQMEPNELINSLITERFNAMDRTLNLNDFCGSKSLNNIEMTLSNSKTLITILTYSGRRYLSNVVELNLSNNNIKSGKEMHTLNWMKNLKVLDLSKNCLTSINELDSISKNTIKQLRLDGNPLCENFKFAKDYINAVTTIFPELTTLDGIILPPNDQIMVQKNFICSVEAYDIVEQFVHSFFTTYDSRRMKLIDMYEDNAIFSMSFYYDTKKINSYNRSKINRYLSRSKNIKKMTNLNRAYTSMHTGKEDVAAILKHLPKTEHDFYSFTTDTTIYNENSIYITVTGVFKEPALDILESDTIFSFSRTFVLQLQKDNVSLSKNYSKYKIVNDIYYISDCTAVQKKNSFKYFKLEENETIEAESSEDKECFTVMFQKITGLKTIWCVRCLEDAKWNFKKALHIFIEMITKKDILENAFIDGQQIV